MQIQITTFIIIGVSVLQFLALLATWKVMRQTAKKQLRAYIGVSEGTKEIVTLKSGTFEFLEIVLHPVNYGKIPARNVRFFYKADLLPKTLDKNFDFSAELIKSEGTVSLFPTQDGAMPCRTRGFTGAEIQEIYTPMGGPRRLFVYGHIIYNDGFVDDRETKFCYTIYWRHPDAETTAEKPDFYCYKTHNEAT